ncbi:putative homeobox-leucine zipper protein HOX26 [Miscanthus floridulus]|uniref:putative homeobox-leucine zipper protein HOX26 n=1 Tax=Miscanthus floridulus TaxID=154761 RepID=UPI003458B21D
MSSLTTATTSMEEQYYSVSAEELGTHLSLGIGSGGGANSLRLALPPPRTVQLFGEVLSVQDDDRHADEAQALRHHRGQPTAAAPASRKKKRDTAVAGGATAAAADRHQSKKAKTTCGDGGGGGRKKLRLTAAQATMLEDSFRAHNILSHGEKQELARRVGLSARQVEVWFQNRRARTKLKQTEVDCDLLRSWCDRLTDDNARLRRDLADLRRAAASSTSLGAAVCASCGGH